jgi:uncharacterized repeat protein (TIGR03803 family)
VFQLSLIDGRWTKTVLYHFTGGAEGGAPSAPLAFDASGHLVGTGWRGGASGDGTVFQLSNTAGEWSATPLVSFDRECSIPTHGEVIFDKAGRIYGMTQFSTPDSGCIYRLSQDGGVWTREVLHMFSRREEGGLPTGGLIFDAEGNLYGLTYIGGMAEGLPEGRGTVFQLAPSEVGWQMNVLHTFGRDPGAGTPLYGNLVLESGALYGTTYHGGSREPFGIGTIFKVEPDPDGRWVETVLHSFQGPDGYQPIGGLLSDGRGTLYGTASKGGPTRCGFGGCGTVYQLNISP